MTMGGVQRGRKEFKVVLDVELGPDVLDRVEKAIQKAVLMELADTAVADAFSVALSGDPGQGIGSTGGIRVSSAQA